MKKKYLTLLTSAVAVAFSISSGFAEQSEEELMKQAKITKTQAEKVALAKVPNGKIRSAEIENELHALVWSFDIAKPGTRNITEVLVDAKSGKIISVSAETPVDQAKESAADKATGNH